MAHDPLAVLDPETRDGLPAADRPGFRPPMLATLTEETDLGPGWMLERKLDGIRCLGIVAGGRVTLMSRNELDLTGRWPDIAEALGALDCDAVVDGEVVATDGDEPLGFEALQQGRGTAALWVFDVLEACGRDLRGLPLGDRTAVLRELVPPRPAVRVVEQLGGDPADRLREACSEGWEGLIAKRADAPYRAGRSRDWLKLKCLLEQEMVVGGFTEPKGSRTGFGALLVGYHEDGRLRYAGKVGTGFGDAVLRDLSRRLRDLERPDSPFGEPVKPRPPGTHWVEPRLVVQVAFHEWTAAGRLRHPRFLGVREDKAPEEVVRERPS